MFQKFATKYGLASHLGILAALPIALMPFLSIENLCKAVFWFVGIAVIWIFFEPSLRKGERLSQARERVRKSILLSPISWFLGFWVVFSFAQYMNNGVSLFYESESAKWLIKDAVLGLPASAGNEGMVLFMISVVASIFIIGVFYALGYNARICCGVASCFTSGLGGLAASLAASFGWSEKLVQTSMLTDLVSGPFMGSLFGVWLIISLACCAQSEFRRWAAARFFLYIAIAGNGAGLLFFAPLVISQFYLAVLLLTFVVILVWVARACPNGAIPRVLVTCVFGIVSSFIVLKACAPADYGTMKLSVFDPSAAFTEVYAQIKNTLSNVSIKIWENSKWFGAGAGAYKINLPFFVEKADWTILPQNPTHAINGYMMILSENGIVGCSVLLSLFLVLIWMYFEKLVKGFVFVRSQDDSDMFFFACLPIVWIAPFAISSLFVDIAFTSASSSHLYILTIVVPLALAAASFPRNPKQKVSD